MTLGGRPPSRRSRGGRASLLGIIPDMRFDWPSLRVAFAAALAVLAASSAGYAQQAPFGRLPSARFDVTPPSARVTGAPGSIAVRQTTCRALPATATRRRIVDVAVQEWAYFGFAVIDRTRLESTEQDDDPAPRPRQRPRLPESEAERLAGSIAGYWTATPSAGWVLARQNEEWKGPDGISARWQYPWSAAFISWVMCEGGLGDAGQFQRAAAHHVYIDQAIRARAARDPRAAFTAYDIGEAVVEPGDLLCSARRPAYRDLAARQQRMGEGARTHCDVVVRVDSRTEQVLAIGGNVGGRVSLKVLPGQRVEDTLRPKAISLGRRGMSAFVHLKLRAASIASAAMDAAPTLQALSCLRGIRPPQLAVLGLDLQRSPVCTE
jgi:hypothetical protein